MNYTYSGLGNQLQAAVSDIPLFFPFVSERIYFLIVDAGIVSACLILFLGYRHAILI